MLDYSRDIYVQGLRDFYSSNLNFTVRVRCTCLAPTKKARERDSHIVTITRLPSFVECWEGAVSKRLASLLSFLRSKNLFDVLVLSVFLLPSSSVLNFSVSRFLHQSLRLCLKTMIDGQATILAPPLPLLSQLLLSLRNGSHCSSFRLWSATSSRRLTSIADPYPPRFSHNDRLSFPRRVRLSTSKLPLATVTAMPVTSRLSRHL